MCKKFGAGSRGSRRQMIIRKLEYLIALAKERHFARAAEACHVSQPTLSAALRHLEAEMGIMILKRGQRYSGLTDHGERVLAFANRMAVECERLRRDLESQRGEALGHLQVGVVASAIPAASQITSLFQKNHPHVMVKIVDLSPTEIQRAFQDLRLDVAITYLEETVRRQGRSHPLYVEEYSFLTRKGHPLSLRKSISWKEASQVPLCLLSAEMQPGNSPVRDILSQLGLNIAHVETNSVTALYAQVRSGQWASILPRSLTAASEAGADLKCIPLLPSDSAPIAVGVMIPDGDLTFPLAEAFFNVAVSLKPKAPSPKKRKPSSR
ncbi:MAG: LysR family transcriptional regulator [Acidobacteriota bacterium]|nr:LysR family transcriptional regulator [Acidobacteriota bacterium]